MSIHDWVALGLGVFLIVIGCGLMALMFYSSRYGYDAQAQSTEYHRDAHCGPSARMTLKDRQTKASIDQFECARRKTRLQPAITQLEDADPSSRF